MKKRLFLTMVLVCLTGTAWASPQVYDGWNNQGLIERPCEVLLSNWTQDSPHANVWLLNGQVTYDKNGMGVGGVTVAFVYDDGGQVSTVTDANGYYQLQPALGHPGTLTITGHTWRKLTDHFASRSVSGKAETWNYRIGHDYWNIKGRVTNYKDDRPATNLKVAFVYNDGGEVFAYTDANGYYALCPAILRAGKIVISAPGWQTKEDFYNARGSETDETWNYVVERANETWEIGGQVTDKNKTGVAGLNIGFFYEDGTGRVTGRTDANGYYQLQPLVGKAGAIRIYGNESWQPIEDRYAARNDSKAKETWNYTVHHNYWTMTGQVRDAQGRPLSNVYVEFVYDNGWTAPAGFTGTPLKAYGYTDQSGYYKIYPLLTRPGTFTIKDPRWQELTDHFSARGNDGEETWNYTLRYR